METEIMMETCDAILLPGGGVQEKGELPPWVKQRLDYALEIHKGEYIIPLSGGTVHKPPPLNEEGFPIFEATAGAHYLIERGVPPGMILTETYSYDTIGNAYFSRVIHVEPAKFRRLRIITSKFHMARVEAIFRWMYTLDTQGERYHLIFDAVPDVGISPDDLQARADKEVRSLKQFLKVADTIHSLRDCHRWLFTEHAAYAGALSPIRITGKSLNTY